MKKDKINLGFTIHTLGRGGAELALINLINNLDREKFNIKLYLLINTGNLKDLLSDDIDIVNVLKVPKFILKRFVNDTGTLVKGESKLSIVAKIYAGFWRHLSNVIAMTVGSKFSDNDLIVSYLEGPTNNLVSKISTKAKKVAWIHVDLEEERKSEIFFKNIEENRRQYDKFDAVVAVSEDVKLSAVNYLGVKRNIVVMHNVYDSEKIKRLSQEKLLDEEKQLFSTEKFNLVSVGRLSAQKGYDRLVDALNLLRQTHRDILEELNILILGEGEDRKLLQNKIDTYKLNDYIKLVGFNENPYKLINQSDAFISSSVTEGFSTVVVESVIIGKPILTTNCSGMKEILNKYENSLIEENSTDGIKNLLIDFVKNHEKYIIDPENKNLFSKSQAIKFHEDFFEEILSDNI